MKKLDQLIYQWIFFIAYNFYKFGLSYLIGSNAQAFIYFFFLGLIKGCGTDGLVYCIWLCGMD